MCKSEMEAAGKDCCVYCNQELAIMERNRSQCWGCQEKTSETYTDDQCEMHAEIK